MSFVAKLSNSESISRSTLSERLLGQSQASNPNLLYPCRTIKQPNSRSPISSRSKLRFLEVSCAIASFNRIEFISLVLLTALVIVMGTSTPAQAGINWKRVAAAVVTGGQSEILRKAEEVRIAERRRAAEDAAAAQAVASAQSARWMGLQRDYRSLTDQMNEKARQIAAYKVEINNDSVEYTEIQKTLKTVSLIYVDLHVILQARVQLHELIEALRALVIERGLDPGQLSSWRESLVILSRSSLAPEVLLLDRLLTNMAQAEQQIELDQKTFTNLVVSSFRADEFKHLDHLRTALTGVESVLRERSARLEKNIERTETLIATLTVELDALDKEREIIRIQLN